MLGVLLLFAPITYFIDPAHALPNLALRGLALVVLGATYFAATHQKLCMPKLGLWSTVAYAVPSMMVLIEVALDGTTDHPYVFAPALFWVGLAMLVPLERVATFSIGLIAMALPLVMIEAGWVSCSARMTGLYIAFAFVITWVAAISSRQRSTLIVEGWRSAEKLQQRTQELELARSEVRHAVEALLKAERRTVMGQLTTGLAGQLLDPLSLLHSRLGDVLARLDADDPAAAALQASVTDLERATIFLQDITAQTADLAQRLEREFDVVSQTRFAARLVERQARGHGLAIRVQGTSGITMRADPARFAQIVSNLIQHAITRCSKDNVTEPIEVVAGLSERGVTLAVSDRAPTPLPTAEALFPDLTGRQVMAGGNDLALAVVSELVEDMGGSIEVECDAPGAAIRLSLPLEQRPAAAASLPPVLLHATPPPAAATESMS